MGKDALNELQIALKITNSARNKHVGQAAGYNLFKLSCVFFIFKDKINTKFDFLCIVFIKTLINKKNVNFSFKVYSFGSKYAIRVKAGSLELFHSLLDLGPFMSTRNITASFGYIFVVI